MYMRLGQFQHGSAMELVVVLWSTWNWLLSYGQHGTGSCLMVNMELAVVLWSVINEGWTMCVQLKVERTIYRCIDICEVGSS